MTKRKDKITVPLTYLQSHVVGYLLACRTNKEQEGDCLVTLDSCIISAEERLALDDAYIALVSAIDRAS